MHDTSIITSLFLIFSGAAVIATLALYARQALLVGYILVGALLGPHALDLIGEPELIADIANVGILFLLFLLGLNLAPRELAGLFREAVTVTLVTSLAFAACGVGIAMLFGFGAVDAALIGACMMFSSTIIALKLLPTSALHHQRMGELIISVLLLQDMLAILVLLLLKAVGSRASLLSETLWLVGGLPALTAFAWFGATRVLTRLFIRFDQIPEYLFLAAIGWCLGIAQLATVFGLSHEIGAFIAGVTLATSPVARYLAEALKPLRDFFLVMFFFALGAGLDVIALPDILLPAILLALVSIALKPYLFKLMLQRSKEKARLAGETGARLGQISEFSLLIVVVASGLELMSERASTLVQSATLISFVFSSYWIVRNYPTPIASDPALRRD